MRARILVLISLILMSITANAQNNSELARMFAEDQADRRVDEIDWEVVSRRDAERRDAALSILRAGEIRTAQDYYNAAMIFQHGGSAEEIRLAHSFATIASALGSSSAANWLKAASWDRLMLRFEQPQWYGTQYVMDDAGEWILYSVDPDAVTDEQRAAWSVPSLEEAKARADAMNGDE
jgi:hypothetical protein